MKCAEAAVLKVASDRACMVAVGARNRELGAPPPDIDTVTQSLSRKKSKLRRAMRLNAEIEALFAAGALPMTRAGFLIVSAHAANVDYSTYDLDVLVHTAAGIKSLSSELSWWVVKASENTEVILTSEKMRDLAAVAREIIEGPDSPQ